MKFVVEENGRNPVKNLPRPRYVHHETHMEGPRRELWTPAVGVERLTAGATRPPIYITNLLLRNPEVHCRSYISSQLVPILRKVYQDSSMKTHLLQIHFNTILLSASRPP